MQEMTKSDSLAPPRIVITGFMATGKTSVAQILADMLGLEFIDTDTEIEKSAGLPVAKIFERHGESYFRDMEKSLCADMKDTCGSVIATGGGTLLDTATFDLFAQTAHIVLLETTTEALYQRLQFSRKRPLLCEDGVALSGDALRERISALVKERADLYSKIKNTVNTTNRRPVEVAAQIAAMLELPSESLFVNPGAGSTDGDNSTPRGRYGVSRVDIGRGSLSKLGNYLIDLGLTGHAFLLMPETTRGLFTTQLQASLRLAGITSTLLEVEDGDARKHLDQTSDIIDRLIDSGARRDATIIPVGGGVTGDIGGFVASLYMRGVPLVHVPTTLLAQVDSSIGGKVGVNHSLAKNLIGSFYQPHLVVVDPCTLRTLPLTEVANGMAEVVKYALVGSQTLFNYLEEQTSSDSQTRLRNTHFLERCVLESARIKCQIVNEDPYEKDRRRTLNLGHTVGHALEASAGYGGLKHGQAVSIGLIAALQIAVVRGTTGKDILDRTRYLLSWCGLPIKCERFDRETFTRSLSLDKKVRNGRLHFVLPTGIGSARVVDDVSVDEILSTVGVA
ncbi:MAG: 3-dehydroquinate synthase [Candidatus Krumholzibacteria bacterium]|nr:3-dehydroquinate synthase [Candidatus Krumholzibacteria bacterium]